MTKPILEIKNVTKSFKQGFRKITVLDNINFSIKSNETVALVGPSGCGKTTLLQIVGLLDNVDKGQVLIRGKNYSNSIFDYTKTFCRRNYIGFIFQSYNLLRDFTALENTMMPLKIGGMLGIKAKKKANILLEEFGLKDRVGHLPSQLSGGEQQRVAIARSIIHDPEIILADEPTGNLDRESSTKIIDILLKSLKKRKKSLLIVTHNMDIAKKADRIMTINNGKLSDYVKNV